MSLAFSIAISQQDILEKQSKSNWDGNGSGDGKELYAVENVSVTYPMGELTVRALRDIDVEIYEGEFLVILGPSGSGKSTLLNILGGMDRPDSGRVLFRSRDLSGLTQGQLVGYRRESVGFVFQFFNLIPTLTTLENVQIAAQLVDTSLDSQTMLEKVGLGERISHFPSQLSGGEQQRVAIARAVVKDPGVILCDEPTGALDFETGKTILEVLRDVHRESGKTTILVTHNAAIGRMADRIIRLRSGHVHEISENEWPADPSELEW